MLIEGDIRTAVFPDRIAVEMWCGGKWWVTKLVCGKETSMFQVGDKVQWEDDAYIIGVVLKSNSQESTIDWGPHGIQTKNNSHLRKARGVKEITITIGKPAWKDSPDQSIYNNIRPGINAAVMYATDGSSWEWAVGTSAQHVLGQGRSIDRTTAKSDAEFFIANYQPEDTSERDEIRRKLERSWHGS